jgi:hypothetical protein
MRCCSNCFNNQELEKIITEISTIKGKCEYCGSDGVALVEAGEIVEPFQPVISLYGIHPDGTKMLHESLQDDWGIFRLTSEISQRLLIDIFSQEKSIDPQLFTSPVVNKTRCHERTENLLSQWNALKDEIRYRNRFFLHNVIDLDTLERYLCEKSKAYKSGELFYRGRISNQKGFKPEDLGKPPCLNASAGRANPYGIPYLYLSADKETTLYEIRATYLDYVTIGKFLLNDDIKVVKLRAVEILSPFEENLFDRLLYQPLLKNLESELSKPLRRFDSELDYLPTQYLCEFVKSIGFDGIEYGSAMKKGGVNLAIFDDQKLTCIDSEVVEIKNIEISF